MDNGGKKPDDFLRETVTNRSAAKRRARRAVLLVASAVAFGLIACVVFVLARPALESRIGRQDPEIVETISLPPETEAETEGPGGTETEPEEDPEPDGGETEVFVPEPTPQERIASANRVIARIRADGTEGTEGFAAGETETAGILFSATTSTGFFLADYSVTEGCTSFVVTLRSGTETPGTLRGADPITGLAVIGVDLEVLEHAGLTAVIPETAGSGTLLPGEPVTAAGAPYGPVYSGGCGQIVYNELNIPAEDGLLEILHTDLSLSDSGFLLNEDGDIVGFSTQTLQESGEGYFYGLSALRPYIERAANGRQIARLGVYVLPSETLAEEDVPHGAVVDSVVLGSPAYESGIQAGDVISEVGGHTVFDAESLRLALFSLTPETETEVIVYRQGRDGYTEQQLTVMTGVR